MESADLDRLLKVCRLRLDAAEKESIKKDICDIIAYFDTIDGVDCSKYAPSYQPVDVKTRTRPDRVEPFGSAASLLKNSKMYRFYVVGPKV